MSLFQKLKCCLSTNIDAIERGTYVRVHGRYDVFACEFCGNRIRADYRGQSWPECQNCRHRERSNRPNLCTPLIRFYNSDEQFRGLDEVNALVQYFLKDTSDIILIIVMGSSLKKDSGIAKLLDDVIANSPKAHRVRIDDGSLDTNWQETTRTMNLFDETMEISCEDFSEAILQSWGFHDKRPSDGISA